MPFGGTVTIDDVESGQTSAAFGGTTCHVDFIIQPKGSSFADAIADWRSKANGKQVIDMGYHMAVTDLEEGGTLEELASLPDEGITSYKLFMAYKGALMVDDEQFITVLEQTGKTGGLVMVHCENGDAVVRYQKEALAAGVDDPNALVQSLHPPVAKTEPKQKEKAEWWSRWLDLESAQKAPMELRLAAEGMYWTHQNMMTQAAIPQAMNQGMIQAAAAAPMAAGQAALQPQEQPAPEQDDSARIEADLTTEREKRQTELATKQIESKTQLQVAETQGEYQLEATRLQGKNQVAAAKARPKPTVTRKTA